jgi:hypothetical protein
MPIASSSSNSTSSSNNNNSSFRKLVDSLILILYLVVDHIILSDSHSYRSRKWHHMPRGGLLIRNNQRMGRCPIDHLQLNADVVRVESVSFLRFEEVEAAAAAQWDHPWSNRGILLVTTKHHSFLTWILLEWGNTKHNLRIMLPLLLRHLLSKGMKTHNTTIVNHKITSSLTMSL